MQADFSAAPYNDMGAGKTKRKVYVLHIVLAKPYLQVNTAALTGWLDDYIWSRWMAALRPQRRETGLAMAQEMGS